MNSDDVIRFWFEELKPEQWWRVDPQLDAHMRARFTALHRGVNRGDHYTWRVTPPGRLAEIIVLDQFSRNMYRGSADAFASDALALTLARAAVATGDDRRLPPPQRTFLYLPYMHSESLDAHEQAIGLFSQPGLEDNRDFELRHKKIIERFGRYPHRNMLLGRTSTKEELEFLRTSGSSF